MEKDHERVMLHTSDAQASVLEDETENRFEKMTHAERKQFIENLKTDPQKKVIIDHMEKMHRRMLNQVNDADSVYERTRFSNFSIEQLEPYLAISVTARKYMQACEYYCEGFVALQRHDKETIDNDKECDNLQSGFRNYSLGLMTENALLGLFPPPANTWKVLNDYISGRPNDVLAQHFRLCLLVRKKDARMSKYEIYKERIIAGESLAEKLRPYSSMTEERMVLIDTYYLLASMYVVTDQYGRACDSFEKCYKLDKTNYKPVYGIGFTQESNKPNEAIRLYHKYLEMAPKCDSQYPDVLYQLGACYLEYFHNKQEAITYYDLGLKAEKEDRLPFEGPVNTPPKQLLQLLKTVSESKGKK